MTLFLQLRVFLLCIFLLLGVGSIGQAATPPEGIPQTGNSGCDPSKASCAPGTTPGKCQGTECFSTVAAQAQFEKDNNCKFEPNPLCKPIDGMSVSSGYLEKLAVFEGKVPQYYNDSNCNCTAGVGHLIHYGQCEPSLARNPILPSATKKCIIPNNILWSSKAAFHGVSVTSLQMLQWEISDLNYWEGRVKRALAGKSVTQAEFDALVDMAYNGGSFILKYVASGDISTAISKNTARGKKYKLSQSRIDFVNSGINDANNCKVK